jgi:hypothetical protein
VRWVFLILILLVSGVLMAREIGALGEARRSGTDDRQQYVRFRRRTKGVLLLLLLFLMAAFFEDISAWAGFGLREGFLYAGAFIIVLFWLLILASRDIKYTAHAALYQQQKITLESLAEIDRELRRENKQGTAAAPPETELKSGKVKRRRRRKR